MKKLLFAGLVMLLIGVWLGRNVHAQGTGVPFSIVATGPLVSCAPIAANTTQYCFPNEGPAVSLAGAPWKLVPISTVTAGVTSWNGLTGVVTYTPPAPLPPPVTSVNGKVGAVVLTVQ